MGVTVLGELVTHASCIIGQVPQCGAGRASSAGMRTDQRTTGMRHDYWVSAMGACYRETYVRLKDPRFPRHAVPAWAPTLLPATLSRAAVVAARQLGVGEEQRLQRNERGGWHGARGRGASRQAGHTYIFQWSWSRCQEAIVHPSCDTPDREPCGGQVCALQLVMLHSCQVGSPRLHPHHHRQRWPVAEG